MTTNADPAYSGGPHLLDDPSSGNIDLSSERFGKIYRGMTTDDIDAVDHWSDKDKAFAWACVLANLERLAWERMHPHGPPFAGV